MINNRYEWNHRNDMFPSHTHLRTCHQSLIKTGAVVSKMAVFCSKSLRCWICVLDGGGGVSRIPRCPRGHQHQLRQSCLPQTHIHYRDTFSFVVAPPPALSQTQMCTHSSRAHTRTVRPCRGNGGIELV